MSHDPWTCSGCGHEFEFTMKGNEWEQVPHDCRTKPMSVPLRAFDELTEKDVETLHLAAQDMLASGKYAREPKLLPKAGTKTTKEPTLVLYAEARAFGGYELIFNLGDEQIAGLMTIKFREDEPGQKKLWDLYCKQFKVTFELLDPPLELAQLRELWGDEFRKPEETRD